MEHMAIDIHTGEIIEENNQRTDSQMLSNAVKEQIEKVTQNIDPVEENPMAVRHARELAKLIENGSEEDHKICAEALVKKAPGAVLEALKSRFSELTDAVVKFKAMAKGL